MLRLLAHYAPLGLRLMVAAVVFVVMVLTGIDVMGRYVFGSPVNGADEIIAAGMGVIIFGSLPFVSAAHEHITIDSIANMLKGKVRRFQTALADFVAAAGLTFFAYELFLLAAKYSRTGEHSSLLHIPNNAIAYLMAAMTAAAATVSLIMVFRPRTTSPEAPSSR